MTNTAESAGKSNHLDQIVQEVVRRLIAAPNDEGRKNRTEDQEQTTVVAEAEPTLRLDDRVVTTELLRNRLEGIKRLVVKRLAVVTPLVKDELRSRNIRLEEVSGSDDGPASSETIQVVCHDTDIPAEASKQLAGLNVKWSRIQQLDGAVEAVNESLRGGKNRSVLVTGQPELAACLANRDRGTRAAHCDSQQAMQRACQTLSCNVLVTQPTDNLLEFIGHYLTSTPS